MSAAEFLRVPPSPPSPPRRETLVSGVVAGAADLDPAAVLTATVAGATFGYSVGWVVLATIPVLWSVFAVSSRIGHDSRKGLIELIRERRGRGKAAALASAIVVVNLAMIIGDLIAVSDSISIITQQPRIFFLAPLAFAVWYMLILGNARKSMERLGLLALGLLAYVAAAILAAPSAKIVAQGIFLPHFRTSSAYMMAVVAVFGSLLTPDVIVWQTSSKRDVPVGLRKSVQHESHAGTFVATMISLSAMVAAAQLNVTDASTMTTRTAAEALHYLGPLGPAFFAIGIIGSGLVALPLLAASLSFSIAEAANWESGLSKRPWEARHFYIVISGIAVLAVIIAMMGVNVVWLLYWSQVMAGFLIVPILWSLRSLGNDAKVVSQANSRFDNICLGGAIGVSCVANVMFLISLLR